MTAITAEGVRMLVPLDSSPLSARVVDGLIDMKENFTSPITLLHVFDLGRLSYRGFSKMTFEEIEDQARERARQFINEQRELFAREGMTAEVLVEEGSVRETICKLAECGDYDLLVIGRPGESDLRNYLFGQVANYLIHNVKCPVLLI